MSSNLLDLPKELLESITEHIASLPDHATAALTLTRDEQLIPLTLSWSRVNRFTNDLVRYLQDHPTVERDTPVGVRYITDFVRFTLRPDWGVILGEWTAIVKQDTGPKTPGLTKLLPSALEAFKRTSENDITEIHWTPPTGTVLQRYKEHHTYYTTQAKMFEALCGSLGSDPSLLPHLRKIVITDDQYLRTLAGTGIPLRHWIGTTRTDRARNLEMLRAAMMLGKSRPFIPVCATLDMFDCGDTVQVDRFPNSLTTHAYGSEPEFMVTPQHQEGERRTELTFYYDICAIYKVAEIESNWSHIMTATPVSMTAHFNVVPLRNLTDDETRHVIDAITANLHAMANPSTTSREALYEYQEGVPSCKLRGRTFLSRTAGPPSILPSPGREDLA